MKKMMTARELRRAADKARRKKVFGFDREKTAARPTITEERAGMLEMEGLLQDMIDRLEDGTARPVDFEDLIDASCVAATAILHRWAQIKENGIFWSEVWTAEELIEQMRELFNRRQDVKEVRAGLRGVDCIQRLNWICETHKPNRATAVELDAIRRMFDIYLDVTSASSMMQIRHDFRTLLNGRQKVSITLPGTNSHHVATRDMEIRFMQTEMNAANDPIIRI